MAECIWMPRADWVLSQRALPMRQPFFPFKTQSQGP